MGTFFLRILNRQRMQAGVDFRWSDRSWTHNIFRLYEVIFGRAYGENGTGDTIRAEMSAWKDKDGQVYQVAHSFEAGCALAETYIRDYLASWKFVPFKVYVPVLQTPQGFPVFTSPYLFAIAFVTSAGTGNNNTPLALTVSGSNTFLHVFTIGDNTDTLSGISYNSIAMTFINKIQNNSDRWTYSYGQVAPTTGTNNITVSGTSFNECGAMQYSGCAQTGQPDSSGTNVTASSGATFSVATTVVASNCWTSNGIYGGVWTSELSGSTGRSITGHRLRDSNGTVGTGSQSLGFNCNAGNLICGITISIAPAVAVADTGRDARLLSLLGVG